MLDIFLEQLYMIRKILHSDTTLITMLMITETTFNILDVSADTRKAYKEDILRLPLRTTTQLDRTRGKHLSSILVFDNTGFKMSKISTISIDFRVSNRL